ncbi:MAG: DUF805 domain-containing protein [Ruminococcaceae bacterium]|nr:DUF805 domain-containing protein [Oscillospiraceae bacterium]
MKTCAKCSAVLENDNGVCEKCGNINEISFLEAFKLYFKKTFVFSGRISKREFWFCFAWSAIFAFVLFAISILSVVIMAIPEIHMLALPLALINGIAETVLTIPFISALCKRIQDTGRPGALVLLYFVCNIIPLIFCFMDGTDGANKYGEKPLR